MTDGGEPFGKFPSILGILFMNLIADAPHNDARMVAVTTNHVAQIAFVPLIKILVVPVFDFCNAPNIESFIEHNQSQFVTELQLLGRGWVVASADSVASHGLHNLKLSFCRTAVDRGTKRTEVVVQADAL